MQRYGGGRLMTYLRERAQFHVVMAKVSRKGFYVLLGNRFILRYEKQLTV